MDPGPEFLNEVLAASGRLGCPFVVRRAGRGEKKPFYAREMTICARGRI
jgi:hypothetical protein